MSASPLAVILSATGAGVPMTRSASAAFVVNFGATPCEPDVPLLPPPEEDDGPPSGRPPEEEEESSSPQAAATAPTRTRTRTEATFGRRKIIDRRIHDRAPLASNFARHTVCRHVVFDEDLLALVALLLPPNSRLPTPLPTPYSRLPTLKCPSSSS